MRGTSYVPSQSRASKWESDCVCACTCKWVCARARVRISRARLCDLQSRDDTREIGPLVGIMVQAGKYEGFQEGSTPTQERRGEVGEGMLGC